MRIEMITLAAGPDGIYRPGQEYDVPDALGKEWCAAGYARPIRARRETAIKAPPETTVIDEKAPKGKRKVKDGADTGDGPDA